MKKAIALLALAVVCFDLSAKTGTAADSAASPLSSAATNNFLLRTPLRHHGPSFGLGADLGLLKSFGNGINIGIGARAFYAKTEENVFMVGLKYWLPGAAVEYTEYANAFSSSTTPQQIEIQSKYKYNVIEINAAYSRYFKGDFEDDFNFYGFIGAGGMLYNLKVTQGSYDQNLYYTSTAEGNKFFGFILKGGLGIEKDLGFAHLITEAVLNVPANQVNGMAVDISIPVSVGLNAGLRFHL
jgi:hypothetical protein